MSSFGNVVKVNPKQKGNPILEHLKQVPWQYAAEIVPDFQVGETNCVLFLSLSYYRLYPEYIFTRFRELKDSIFALKVLLLLVDVDQNQANLRDIARHAIDHEMTLILAWSQEDAAKYIEILKAYEHKPPNAVREQVDPSHFSKFSNTLTQIKSVNKTDVVTLASNFTNLYDVIHATPEQLNFLPGFGDQKVKRILDAFEMPFLSQS